MNTFSFRTILSVLFVTACIVSFAQLVVTKASSTNYQNPTYINESFLSSSENAEVNAIDLNAIVIIDQSEGFSDNQKPIIEYTVAPNDTLASIATKFGVTVNHIKKVNNLESNVLRVGQKLHITSMEGFIIELEQPTNPLVFANQYNIPLEDILSANGFFDKLQRLEKGEEIFVPLSREKGIELGLLKEPQQNEQNRSDKPALVKRQERKPTAIVTTRNNSLTPTTLLQQPRRGYMNDAVASVSRYNKSHIVAQRVKTDGLKNGFVAGNCTRFAANVATRAFPKIEGTNMQFATFRGDAGSWCTNAKKAGFKIAKTPSVGAIFVSEDSDYGHVGIVIDVDWNERKILVEDMNYIGRYIVTKRRILMNEDMTQPIANSKPFKCFIPKQKTPSWVREEIEKMKDKKDE